MLGLLAEVLATLYPEYADWKRLTVAAGLDFTRLFYQTSSLNFWYEAVHEADLQHDLAKLIETAYAEYPHNTQLNEILQYYAEQPPRH